MAVLASAKKLRAGLAARLAELVPPLASQPEIARDAELLGFLDDYMSLLRWRYLHTARTADGRLPAQAQLDAIRRN